MNIHNYNFTIQEEERKIQKPKDLETTINWTLQNILDGGSIKDVLVQDIDIPVDYESLKSIDLHTIINPPTGSDPNQPYKFDIYGKEKLQFDLIN